MKKVKGLSQKKTPHRHRQPYGDEQREKGVGIGRRGKGEHMVTEGDLTLSGECEILYTDDVL